MVAKQPHVYDKLSNDKIRLIELLPGRFEEPLACHIIAVKLSKRPQYEAISYVWGDAKVRKPIYTSKGYINITTNLADALRQLRHPQSKRTLFADAICINQEDVNEKNDQVAMMAEVYQYAKSVVIWLGSDTRGDSSLAFKAIRGYAEYAADMWMKTSTSAAPGFRPFEECVAPALTDLTLDAVASVLHRPWFSRVWVLQEAALARHATVVCGSSTIPLEDLICFADAASRNLSDWLLDANIVALANCYAQVFAPFRTPGTWMDSLPFEPQHLHGRENAQLPLGDLLRMAMARNTTDQRDRIFALLGHPALRSGPGGQKALVSPDYTANTHEICRRTFVAAINNKSDLSLLSLVQHGPRSKHTLTTSWVPNLRVNSDIIDSFFLQAGQSLKAHAYADDSMRLHCSGVRVGSVGCFTETFPYSDELKETKEAAGRFVNVLTRTMSLEPLVTRAAELHSMSNFEFLATILLCTTGSLPEEFLSDKSLEIKVRLLRSFLRWQEMIRGMRRSVPGFTSEDFDHFRKLFWACSNRKIFRIDDELWGLGPGSMETGDTCCIIGGTRVPYILHPTGDAGGTYTFVGECFVPGLMFGGVRDLVDRRNVKQQNFVIC